MVPSTVGAILAFAVFVVPGILFELLRQRRRPTLGRTTFEELTSIVLSSALFSALALAALVVVRIVDPRWMPNPAAWLHDSTGYMERQYRLIARTFVVEALLACLFVALVHRSLNKEGSRGYAARVVSRIDRWMRQDPHQAVGPFPVWWTVLRGLAPDQTATVVSVRTMDGRVFTGRVGAYTTSGSGKDRDLALRTPIEVVRPGFATTTLPDDIWRFLIVRAADIEEIAVRYDPVNRPAP